MVALEYPVPGQLASAQEVPLSVGVLVDLELGIHAGGHVKCWERLAAAATAFPDLLDLTVHFTGPRRRVEPLGPNVRYVVERPLFSTARLPFLSHVPDHTDLAPFHPRLAAQLGRYDVIHATDAFFAYARTALRFARRTGTPLVTSVHTSTPGYARIYTGRTIERLIGRGWAGHLLIDRLAVDRRVEERMLTQLEAYQRACAFTLVSRPEQLAAARAVLGDRVGILRRGIDRTLFTPQRHDRAWLAETLGVPVERAVLLFVGRLNHGKNVMFLVEAVARLIERGLPVQLVCAGQGDQREAILARLGGKATCPGVLPPATLARLYASADIFAFPSQIEESANVVLEALASGLPVLVARESGMGRVLVDGETGVELPGDSVEAWVDMIAELLRGRDRLARMAAAARRYAEARLPSWESVLIEDLLPRWQAAARHRPLP